MRKLAFSKSGKLLVCGSIDGRLAALKCESGKVKVRVDGVFGEAVKEPLGALLSLDEEDQTFVIGNDQGDIKVILLIDDLFPNSKFVDPIFESRESHLGYI